jgi:hypothetical protein
MKPLTPLEVANALELVSDSDVCENNTSLGSILLIASSHIKHLCEINELLEWAKLNNINVVQDFSWFNTHKGDQTTDYISSELTFINALRSAKEKLRN